MGFTKQCSNNSQSEKSHKPSNSNERQKKNLSGFLHQNSNIKRHSCASSETKSETSVRSSSLPPRPITRRHPYEMPNKLQKSRSASETPVIKPDIAPLQTGVRQIKRKRKLLGHKVFENKGKTSNRTDENDKATVKTDQINQSPRKDILSSSEHSGKSKTEEHEYLQFLLRITEDIILNNYFKNEDIEKVFQSHIEINKHRLALEKMEIQIMRLANELNIPYKSSIKQFVEQKAANNFHCTYEAEFTDNCECSTKRTLNFSGSCSANNNDCDEKNLQEDIEELLSNKHSLGRVTECTEPTNSIDTIFNASTKFPSITTISSFGNIDVLPCFENSDLDLSKRSDNFYQTIVYDSNSMDLIKFNDMPLTEKEQIGCLEEDIIFRKLNKSYQFLVSNNYSQDKTSNGSLNLKGSDLQEKVEKSETGVECIDTSSQNTVCLNKISSIYLIDEKVNSNEELAVDLPGEVLEIETTSSVIKMDDKYTQVEITYCDKECTAQENFENGMIEESNYILINGPVYVKKRVLQSDEKLIVLEQEIKKPNIECMEKKTKFSPDDVLLNQHVDRDYIIPTVQQKENVDQNNIDSKAESFNNENNKEPTEPLSVRSVLEKTEKDSDHEEISLFNRPLNISDYSLDTYAELDQSYMRKISYSKLLNSDYDLTPQRDSTNSTDKYHHLLVDATTSISNMYSPECNLLITEDYYMLKPDSESVLHDKQRSNIDTNKDYCVSCNDLLKDDKYEINNCNLPEELNESMKLFESRNKMRKITDIIIPVDIPSTDYDITSDISTSIEGGQVSGRNYELGDIDSISDSNKATSSISLQAFQEENRIPVKSSCHNSKRV